MSWCCTDPSMAHPGGNKCANGAPCAGSLSSRAFEKDAVSVTPGALDSCERARRGERPGAAARESEA